VIAPGIGGRVRLLQDKMVAALKGQEMTDRKAGLSATDDKGVYVSGHEMSS
jgi:hypothetical protein